MKKFLFDTVDFDEPEVVDTAPTFSEADLATTREDAYRRGYSEGQTQGRAEAAQAAQDAVDEKLRILLEDVSTRLRHLTSDEDRREMEKCIDAARLALHVVHKLMPQLAQNHGLPEVERIIARAIDARRDEPRIAITVAPALLEHVKERINPLAQERGFAGKMIVVADEAMALSDCRVEWADGGSERLMARLMGNIEDEFTRAILGMQGALPAQDAENALIQQEQEEEIT